MATTRGWNGMIGIGWNGMIGRGRAGTAGERGPVVLVALGLLASGCGGGGGADAGSVQNASPEVARACLEEAGYEVDDSTTTQELQDAMGVVAAFTLSVDVNDPDVDFGLGTLDFHESEAKAEEALDASRAVSTEEVVLGRVGVAEYRFAGGAGADQVAATIEDCVTS